MEITLILTAVAFWFILGPLFSAEDIEQVKVKSSKKKRPSIIKPEPVRPSPDGLGYLNLVNDSYPYSYYYMFAEMVVEGEDGVWFADATIIHMKDYANPYHKKEEWFSKKLAKTTFIAALCTNEPSFEAIRAEAKHVWVESTTIKLNEIYLVQTSAPTLEPGVFNPNCRVLNRIKL